MTSNKFGPFYLHPLPLCHAPVHGVFVSQKSITTPLLSLHDVIYSRTKRPTDEITRLTQAWIPLLTKEYFFTNLTCP